MQAIGPGIHVAPPWDRDRRDAGSEDGAASAGSAGMHDGGDAREQPIVRNGIDQEYIWRHFNRIAQPAAAREQNSTAFRARQSFDHDSRKPFWIAISGTAKSDANGRRPI